MEIIPAIDIKEGKCVRLYQGDYNKETVYSNRPEEVALSWQEQGAARLHIVDLEAAASGELINLEVIKRIRKKVEIPLQVGGGLRSLESLGQLSEIGIERFVLGTAAVENPGLVKEACHLYGERAIVSIDSRDGKVYTEGWLKSSRFNVSELISNIKKLGIKRFIITDIARDGTLSGPNFDAMGALVKQKELKFIASGGISSLEHVVKLKEMGLEAAIIGKALYSGELKLKDATEKAKDAD